MDESWQRYAKALISSMREVLAETAEAVHPALLETADYWLSIGMTLGVNDPDKAGRLLTLIEANEGERRELQEDAKALADEVLR
jgi:hypothetical protein